MFMLVGALIVLVGVVYGLYTIQGSGISERPYGPSDAGAVDEDPLDLWSRGTR